MTHKSDFKAAPSYVCSSNPLTLSIFLLLGDLSF